MGMTYHLLGGSGLRVSRLALGTMTFGTENGWGCDRAVAAALLDRYLEAGGNFIDTADVYTQGTSERWLGEFIAERSMRERIVLATKFTHNFANQEGDPNAAGNGRKNILRAVEGSLRRLRTEYIDLYLLHTWDRVTPVEEVLRTLDDLVTQGKVRHFGLSDVPACTPHARTPSPACRAASRLARCRWSIRWPSAASTTSSRPCARLCAWGSWCGARWRAVCSAGSTGRAWTRPGRTEGA